MGRAWKLRVEDGAIEDRDGSIADVGLRMGIAGWSDGEMVGSLMVRWTIELSGGSLHFNPAITIPQSAVTIPRS
jgi:hypothetical protein